MLCPCMGLQPSDARAPFNSNLNQLLPTNKLSFVAKTYPMHSSAPDKIAPAVALGPSCETSRPMPMVFDLCTASSIANASSWVRAASQ